MKEYNIGQVLFILLKGDTNIHPVLITEEVRKKTIQGSTVEYTVELVLKSGKRNKVMLNELDAHIFNDIGEARNFLISNATKAINDICDTAALNADKWFAKKPDPVSPLQENVDTSENNSMVGMIELSNGVVARVRLPPELQ